MMIVAALALTGAACGSSEDGASSKAKDEGAESSGKSAAGSDDGAARADCGEMTSMENFKLPADWPSEISFPEDTKLHFGYSDEGCQEMQVAGQMEGNDGKEMTSYGKEVTSNLQSQLTDLGYTIGDEEEVDGEMPSGSATYSAEFTASNADREIAVEIDAADGGVANIELTITKNS
ncbi:MAG: hypothetical protein ABI239_12685 [Aquihabitans sp.]